MADLSVSQMKTYVANRAGKGMNSLYFSAIACTGTGGNDKSGTTYDAITPFTGGITSLRATYWARLDALVNLCERYGSTVWLNLYDGWSHVLFGGYSASDYQSYGSQVASRYLSKRVWMFGGDYFPGTVSADAPATEDQRYKSILDGSVQPGRPSPRRCSSAMSGH